jgi:hypothetical protein
LAAQPSFRLLAAKQKKKALGFSNVRCGEDGPLAWAIAQQWNARWQEMKARLRRGEPTTNPANFQKIYPPGSLGEAFARLRETENWKRKAPGTQVEWERTWKVSIDPVFGDVAPKIGIRESHRALKIWRALWEQAVVVFKTASGEPYGDRDLSLGIRRKTPTPRNAPWKEGEAVRLVKRAWCMGYRGLAGRLRSHGIHRFRPSPCARSRKRSSMAMPKELSSRLPAPRPERRRSVPSRSERNVCSTPTWRRCRRISGQTRRFSTPEVGCRARRAGGRSRPRHTPRTRSGMVSRRAGRIISGDKRKIMDFRRSGSVEGIAGKVAAEVLAAKMANTIDRNKELQATYPPTES